MKWITAALLVFGIVGAASAEPELGTRIDPAPKAPTKQFKPDEAAQLMNAFARCLAHAKPRLARPLLDLPLASEEQSAAAHRAVGGEELCMGRIRGELRFRPLFLIGGMAEELFVSEFGERDVVSLVGAAHVPPRNQTEDLALCVSQRNPRQIRELINTQAGSKQEAAAVTRLIPDIGPCVPDGMTLKFTKSAMRSLFAAGLYRLVTQAAAPQTMKQ